MVTEDLLQPFISPPPPPGWPGLPEGKDGPFPPSTRAGSLSCGVPSYLLCPTCPRGSAVPEVTGVHTEGVRGPHHYSQQQGGLGQGVCCSLLSC